uniref:ERCC4 domain-containing protein n=1 Tax=viral metagenome TaxID=1070528 RepID=A0A6C0JFB0_9ZZZZ
MVELIIDNRENIKNLIKDDISNSKFENLDLGDYIYKVNGETIIIIERKTISDYASSILDGRNREQKKRLLDNYDKSKIIYLVEGELDKNNKQCNFNRINADTLVSSIINTMLRDQIQVFHTTNKSETVFILQSIYKKLEKQGKSFLENDNTYEESLINSKKIKKGDNLTPELVFKMMLNCIPGVSNKVSNRINQKFKNMKEFIDKLLEYENKKDMEQYIINLKMDDSEKGRKISKNISKNIVEFLNIL